MPLTHLSEKQITTLLLLAERRPRDHALFSVFAYTALRVSDILRLNLRDVLDEYGRVRPRLVLWQRKTGVRHDIALAEPLKHSLRRYLGERNVSDRDEPLFVNLDRNTEQVRQRGTRRLSPVGVHKIFKKYLALTLSVSKKDLAGLATHTLRRSLAMMLYEKEGIGAAQQLLGHKSISSTGAYLNKLITKSQANKFLEGLNFASAPKSKAKPRR